jgi:hypothetical protein
VDLFRSVAKELCGGEYGVKEDAIRGTCVWARNLCDHAVQVEFRRTLTSRNVSAIGSFSTNPKGAVALCAPLDQNKFEILGLR